MARPPIPPSEPLHAVVIPEGRPRTRHDPPRWDRPWLWRSAVLALVIAAVAAALLLSRPEQIQEGLDPPLVASTPVRP